MPNLRDSMFRDRASHFSNRLKWDVNIDDLGREKDQYDDLNPVYIIAADSNGKHFGSMRMLPTTGRTMINEHFSHLNDGRRWHSPYIWECTRFCVSSQAPRTTAALVLAAGAKMMHEFGIRYFVGVFDPNMLRVYSRLSSKPIVFGSSKCRDETVCGGLWSFEVSSFQDLIRKAKSSSIDMELSFVNSHIGKGVLQTELQLGVN